MQPYTRWSSDWLTPWLVAHWHTQSWKVYAVYPVILILAIAFIRRAREAQRPAAGWRCPPPLSA